MQMFKQSHARQLRRLIAISCCAVVAAVGRDDVLCVVPGAAVAGWAGLVHQSRVFLAWPHAHAGRPIFLMEL